MKEKAPLVGVINSDLDITSLINGVLEDSGFRTATTTLTDLQLNSSNYLKFLRTYNPRLLIIDVPSPYQENCLLMKSLINMDKPPTSERIPILVTTTNKSIVEDCMKPFTFKILEVPFDVDELTETVTHLIRTHKVRRLP